MLRTKLSALAALAMLVGGVAAQDAPTITYWDTMNDNEREVFGTIVEACGVEAGVTVDYQYVPFSDAQNQFRTAAQADEAPDVLRAEIAWGPEFAANGYLLDLTDQVSAEEAESYLAAPFAYNTWGNRVWGLPQVTDAPALMYNKAIFEAAGVEVPTTLDELAAAAEAIAALDDVDFGLATFWDMYPFQAVMWGFGGGLITPNEDGTYTIGVNSEGTVAAIEWTKALLESGAMGPAYDPANQYGNSIAAFKEGKAGMIFMGPWATGDVLTGPAFEDPANLGVAPIPAGPAGQGSPVGGHGYVIYAGTAYPEESLAFIRCLNSVENQVLLATELSLVPTLKAAYEDPALAENETLQGFLAQMEVATNRPVLVAGGSIYTAFGPEYSAALLGEKDVQEALDAVAAAWEELLANEPTPPSN